MHEDLGQLPAWEFNFHFKSGRDSINLVTTVGERWRRSFERLRTPADLGRWTAEAGLLADAPPVTAAELDGARALREAIYRIAKPDGNRPAPADVAEMNRWAALPPLAPQVSADLGATTWQGDRPVEAVLSTVARDAIDLFTGPLAERIRECAADDCSLMFVDTSRPGRRRWCSMGACGNRDKTKAYRKRRATEKEMG